MTCISSSRPPAGAIVLQDDGPAEKMDASACFTNALNDLNKMDHLPQPALRAVRVAQAPGLVRPVYPDPAGWRHRYRRRTFIKNISLAKLSKRQLFPDKILFENIL
jgi:hypothetical protein